MRREDGCIFCRIADGEAPCHRVAEDALTLVFMDLFPAAEGHTLVVSREHFENVHEATPDAMAGVGVMSKRVADALREAVPSDGLAVYQANGVAAGQTVFHYHMHLIPRVSGTELRLHGRRQGDPQALADQAARIAERMEGA